MSVALAYENVNPLWAENMPTYKVKIHAAEGGGYWAVCDMANGGCTTQGDTLQETQLNMLNSVAFYLEDFPEITNYFLSFEVNCA